MCTLYMCICNIQKHTCWLILLNKYWIVHPVNKMDSLVIPVTKSS